MAEALDRIYDALLLDHIRSARNYGLVPDGPPAVEIANPLCGDVLQVQAWLDDDRIRELRFSCECCGIAMGNASLMTETLRGLASAEAAELAGRALALLSGAGAAAESVPPGDAWALLHAVSVNLPARRTCASLGWQAVLALLQGETHCIAREIRG